MVIFGHCFASELFTEAYYDGDVDDAVASKDDSDYFELDDDTDGDDNEEEVNSMQSP